VVEHIEELFCPASVPSVTGEEERKSKASGQWMRDKAVEIRNQASKIRSSLRGNRRAVFYTMLM